MRIASKWQKIQQSIHTKQDWPFKRLKDMNERYKKTPPHRDILEFALLRH